MSEQKYTAGDVSSLMPSAHSEKAGSDKWLPVVLYGHLAIVLLLAGLLLKEPKDDADTQLDVDTHYMFFQHVSIMIFVGFGFLMTFLKRYSFSAVGLNLMLSCFVYIWNMTAASFWEQVAADETLHRLAVSLPLMIEGLFGAGAVMISFGAVLGRTQPSQLVFIAFWEIVFYSFNFYLGALELKATDAGGSMFIHLFGALFGVAMATQLSPAGSGLATHPNNGSRYTSDLTAMIGTIFLFIFWPSFNGGLTAGSGQLRAILNTTLSLAGSVMAAFGFSHLLNHGKFDMVHIQNCTVAGAVAMGTSANLALNPVASVLIGFAGGSVSVFGYRYLSPFLGKKFNLADTCGVINLHGSPGLLGAIVGIIAVATLNDKSYPTSGGAVVREDDRDEGDQTLYQVYTLLVTIGISIVGGLLTGFCANKFFKGTEWPAAAYNDHPLWEVPDDFTAVGVGNGITPEADIASTVRRVNVKSSEGNVLSPSKVQPMVTSPAAAVPGTVEAV